MFCIDEVVVHPNSGVCRIADIRTERFASSAEKYYVLSPVFSTSPTRIYVPVSGNRIKLRYPLSKQAVLSAIDSSLSVKAQWLDDEKERNERFSSVLREKEPTAIIEMICELHKKRIERASEGKKLKSNDEKILSEAEKLIHLEFAYVLGIDPDNVAKFIMNRLNIEDETKAG